MNQTSPDRPTPGGGPADGDAPLRDDENSPYRQPPEDERTSPDGGELPDDQASAERPPESQPPDESPDAPCACGSECGVCGAGGPGRGGHALHGWRLAVAAAVMFIEPLIFAIVGAILASHWGFSPSAGAIIGLLAGVVTAAVEVRLVVRKSAGGDGEDEPS